MGLLDLLVSKEQRLINQQRRIEKENRELRAEIGMRNAEAEQRKLRTQLDEFNRARAP
jgi:hypothetical protein